ncbi:MAG: hypothetical protein WC350_01295 [Candidatus Micrarchaeia archaeon]|jgi:hypothetical protein
MATTANLAGKTADMGKWTELMAKGRLRGALELAKSCGDEKCTRSAALALYGFLMRQAYEYGNVKLYLDARKVAVENNLGLGRIEAAERGMNEFHPAHRND